MAIYLAADKNHNEKDSVNKYVNTCHEHAYQETNESRAQTDFKKGSSACIIDRKWTQAKESPI